MTDKKLVSNYVDSCNPLTSVGSKTVGEGRGLGVRPSLAPLKTIKTTLDALLRHLKCPHLSSGGFDPLFLQKQRSIVRSVSIVAEVFLK